MTGQNKSVSKLESVPCIMQASLSRPLPVSMFLLGSSLYSLLGLPGSELNWEKTIFQISIYLSFSISSFNILIPMFLGSYFSPLSKKISVSGPQGPSPISQKLPSNGIKWSSSIPPFIQSFLVSKSSGWYVMKSFSLGIANHFGSVKSSTAHGITSFLK